MPIPRVTAIYKICKELDKKEEISLLESLNHFRSSENREIKLEMAVKISAFMISYITGNSLIKGE